MTATDPVAGSPALIRLLVAEDHQIVREALVAMLTLEGDIEVVASVESGPDAVRLAIDLEPDVVLMDVGFAALNGIDATRKIVDRAPSIGVVLLTMQDDEDTVARAVAAGARGYVPKIASPVDLVHAIRTVASGDAYLHHAVTGAFLRRVAPFADQSMAFERLTDREHDVLLHLSEGMTTRQIGRALHIGDETVRTHLGRIYQKLGARDRVQAVALAIRRGLVS